MDKKRLCLPCFRKTMGEFLQVCPKRLCISTVGTRRDLFQRDPYKVPITDFFGSVRNVELTSQIMENLTEFKVPPQETKEVAGESKKIFQYFDQLPILKEL